MFDTISNTITFRNEALKRKAVFHVNLIHYCNTRFIQRHDFIVRFSENSENVIYGLEDILQILNLTQNSFFSCIVPNYLNDSNFLISLASAKNFMYLILILSRILEQVNLDFCIVFAIVDATILELSTMQDAKEDIELNKLENSAYNEAEIYTVIAELPFQSPDKLLTISKVFHILNQMFK